MRDFMEAKAEHATLDAQASAAGEVLRRFPRGATGLVSDAVRATPEYQEARAAYQRAFTALQKFNQVFVKQYAKELRAERAARR